MHPLAVADPARRGRSVALEVRILRVHVTEEVRLGGHRDRIDPERWRPLIMSFQHFFGLGERVHPSRLAGISEEAYRVQGVIPSAPAEVIPSAARDLLSA